MTDSKWKKEDFIQLSWEQYGKTLEILSKKVSEYLERTNIKIDAVVPILRGGAFPGTYLAYKLNLLRILPVQYKYFFKDGTTELRKILSISSEVKLPPAPTFLLVESNHCFGLTAQTAVDDLKEQYPGCKIIYAVDHIDYSHQKIDGVEVIIYGKLTDETRALTQEKAKEVVVEFAKSYLLPWENMDEEWTTVQGQQFEYGDVNESLESSEFKVVPKYE